MLLLSIEACLFSSKKKKGGGSRLELSGQKMRRLGRVTVVRIYDVR